MVAFMTTFTNYAFSHEDVTDVWFQYDSVPLIGMLSYEDEEYVFTGTWESEHSKDVLYLYAKLENSMLQKLLTSQITFKDALTDSTTVLYREIETGETISIVNVDASELSDAELPVQGVYLF